MQIKLSASLDRIVMNLDEFISVAQANGMVNEEIFDYIMNDIQGSGRFFGAFKNDIASLTRNGIEKFANVSANEYFESHGVEQWQWIAAGGNVCPDCAERHGLTGDAEFFDAIGREKSGFSVCQDNCQCKIIPIDYKGENLDQPLKRGGSESRR